MTHSERLEALAARYPLAIAWIGEYGGTNQDVTWLESQPIVLLAADIFLKKPRQVALDVAKWRKENPPQTAGRILEPACL